MIPPNTSNVFRFPLIAFSFLSLLHKSLSIETCPTYYCPSAASFSGDRPEIPAIRFPFIAANSNRSRRCGYPGFYLTCDGRNQQPILTLPSSGDFSVQVIDYVNLVALVSDPDNCLPKRILSLNLARSPFSGAESRNFTFLNCTGNSSSAAMAAPVPCLSGRSYTVYATYMESAVDSLLGSGECKVMKSVWSPSLWPLYDNDSGPDLDRAVMALGWDAPDCGECERQGGSCGFAGDSGLEVGCSDPNATRGKLSLLDMLVYEILGLKRRRFRKSLFVPAVLSDVHGC